MTRRLRSLIFVVLAMGLWPGGREAEAQSFGKFFMEVSKDPKATASQKATVALVLKSYRVASPELAWGEINREKALVVYGDGSADSLVDLSPLADFTQIDTLVLYNNRISDLSPLSGLTNLKTLRLELNRISDISPLSSLVNLESLQIENNQITDISAIASLKNLRALWLSDNKIKNIGPLAGLMELSDIYLNGNPIGDLTPLTKTTAADIRLQNCELRDITALRGLPENIEAFRVLDLSKNQITDITPIGKLERIANLDLSDNRIADISALKNENLSSLELQNNQITDVSPLAQLPALGTVNVKNNPIKDYGPLVALAKARPEVQIVADKGFEIALKKSTPAKAELRESPLIGRWLTPPIKTDMFGTLRIEFIFEDNGQFTRRLIPVDAPPGTPMGDSSANPPQRGTFELKGGVLAMGPEETYTPKFEKPDVLLLEGKGTPLRLERQR